MATISSLKTLMRPQWSRPAVGRLFSVYPNSQSSNEEPFQSAVDNHDSSPNKYRSQDGQFSGDRSRDFMGQAFSAKETEEIDGRSQSSVDSHHPSTSESAANDDKLDSYDCHGSVSLNAVMQSTVPEPFSSKGDEALEHYNMPGGHTLQGQKYLSDDLQNTHYQHQPKRKFASLACTTPHLSGTWTAIGRHQYAGRRLDCRLDNFGRNLSNIKDKETEGGPGHEGEGSGQQKQQLTSRAKLKRAIKDYGSTVIVFHVTISLASLGVCYLAVSSGVDVNSLLAKFVDVSSLTAGLGTFALAYAIHKVLAPVRIGITLAAVPFIVRYLRSIGFLKSPPRKT